MVNKILVINPGSTSTKVAVFDDEEIIKNKTLAHSHKKLKNFNRINDQYKYRKDQVLESLEEMNIALSELNAVVARGGLLKPLKGGTYEINDLMYNHLMKGVEGEHASNLGGLIARELSDELFIPGYIVDPVVVDEMEQVAKVSGFVEVDRKSIFHALNQKAVARKVSGELGKNYNEAKIIVSHLGGGISVGVHKYGKVVDVNNALDGDGPFSPERCGSLPWGDLLKNLKENNKNYEEAKKDLIGNGGLASYLGTTDARKVEELIENNDDKAKLIFEAMAYQVAKEIGACSVVVDGEVDALVLTGGLSNSERLVNLIKKKVNFIAPVYVFPGEFEMQALALGALRVLRNEEKPKKYMPG
ncbi:butyrate kinase [Natranaerofaba carboxydovora]|uniref:butyrate kinase n=1 Tax=Natranaerofaba carboxydovora TaxID=2742683 RepID=UPI001F131E6A|nr:butyrate kinase [Natranaerofaba carboxydovora]UMZ73934.1 putative butyrate kinase 2 [Natranaerofaba carboxydovora]